jgi:hypothetical protein
VQQTRETAEIQYCREPALPQQEVLCEEIAMHPVGSAWPVVAERIQGTPPDAEALVDVEIESGKNSAFTEIRAN